MRGLHQETPVLGADHARPPSPTIPLGTPPPGALTVAEIDATMAHAEAEKSLMTRRP